MFEDNRKIMIEQPFNQQWSTYKVFLIKYSSVCVLVTLHPLVCLKSLPQWWSKSSYHIEAQQV